MTVQPSEMLAPEAQPWADDEIDLRHYVVAIGAWWREIVVITLVLTGLAAAAAWLWQNSLPTLYAASTDVVIARLTSRIALDERITTEEEIRQGGVASWRASLLQLAQSPAIADAVLAELRDQLPSDWTVKDMLEAVTVENPAGADPRTLSDLIRITISSKDPAHSALIANTWARLFVEHVNQLYGQVPADTLAAVQGELKSAHAAYLQAEQAFQLFIAESEAGSLQRQIDEQLALRKNLQQGRNTLLAAGAINANQVMTSTLQDNLAGLTQLYSQRRVTEIQLNQARNLATQLEQASPATVAGNLLALQLLKAQVFARPVTDGGQPPTLDLRLDLPALSADADALADDARTLVATLEGYRAQLDTEIAAVSETLLSSPSSALAEQISIAPGAISTPATSDPFQQALDQHDRELQALHSRLAADEARELQLTQQRDLSWTAYDTLSNKLVELNLARTASNSEVRIGASAVAPAEPEPQPSLLLPLSAVAVASLFFALCLALIANAMGRKPLFARP